MKISKKDMKKLFLDFIDNLKAFSSCPLAFSELGVKSRIKTILNYKKPSFYLVIVSLAIPHNLLICKALKSERKIDVTAAIEILDLD